MKKALRAEKFPVTVDKDIVVQCTRFTFPTASSSSNSADDDQQPNDGTTTTTNAAAAAAATTTTATTAPKKSVIVCVHPFGKMGGSGYLLRGICHKTCILGQGRWDCVTFDQRGVGTSGGSSTWTCQDEVEDVKKVCCELATNPKLSGTGMPFEKVFLVGSSAGACVAGSALDSHEQIAGYVGIGYPFGWAASILFSGHYKHLFKSTKPKLLVHAEDDGFTSMSQFADLKKKLQGERNETIIIPEVGHFEMESPEFDGEMSRYIAKFVASLM